MRCLSIPTEQVRAESTELKATLDDRRAQLADLRRHLEKESTENGILEAAVQHRASRNERGDVRLREELESALDHVIQDEEIISSRATAVESDVAAIEEEHRQVQERIRRAASWLNRAAGNLDERERTLAEGQRESARLVEAVQQGRRVVATREAALAVRRGRLHASHGAPCACRDNRFCTRRTTVSVPLTHVVRFRR